MLVLEIIRCGFSPLVDVANQIESRADTSERSGLGEGFCSPVADQIESCGDTSDRAAVTPAEIVST